MKISNRLSDAFSAAGADEFGLTIGNFDGVHLGHQELLHQIKTDCENQNYKFAVITFVPHPHQILQPEKKGFLINSYQQRRKYLEEIGVDLLVEIKFDRDFSTLSPESFLKTYIAPYPQIRKLYLGYDFAFGANKSGSHNIANELLQPLGIEVELQEVFQDNNGIVSSTLIREKLLEGEVVRASELLGRPFSLDGVVIKGEGRGKKIGYPTANIKVSEDQIIPAKGVYVTRTIYQGMTFNSVTNIGSNPTFNNSQSLNIETNLFDFNSDIYGEEIEVKFIQKIRDEKKFPTVNDLIKQISSDVKSAKEILGEP